MRMCTHYSTWTVLSESLCEDVKIEQSHNSSNPPTGSRSNGTHKSNVHWPKIFTFNVPPQKKKSWPWLQYVSVIGDCHSKVLGPSGSKIELSLVDMPCQAVLERDNIKKAIEKS